MFPLHHYSVGWTRTIKNITLRGRHMICEEASRAEANPPDGGQETWQYTVEAPCRMLT